MAQKILYYCNITVVLSYLIFCLLFILRFPQSGFFWNNCLWFALICYSVTLYIHLKNQFPSSFSLISVLQFLNLLSGNPNGQYLIYCIIIFQANHISAVALFPLAINGFINTSDIFNSLINSLCVRFPNIITRTVKNYYFELNQQRNLLVFMAAAAEVLTFPILFWRWISGVSQDISLIHLILLGQFLNQRKNSSEHTQRIITGVYPTFRSYFQSWFPQ